jgi:hypothetical protein
VAGIQTKIINNLKSKISGVSTDLIANKEIDVTKFTIFVLYSYQRTSSLQSSSLTLDQEILTQIECDVEILSLHEMSYIN